MAKKTESASKASEKVALPRSARSELGVGGEQLISTYYNEEYRQDDLGILDYRRMKNNDGQVQMLLNALVNTILSAKVRIIDDPDYAKEHKSEDGEENESEEKKFIEQNLFSPAWKGGLDNTMPFALTNRYNLRALEEGFRVFEVVYRVDPDGKIRLRKLAPRGMRISESELKLIVDEHGDFSGFHQQTSVNGKVVDIVVKNDSEVSKTINVKWGGEYGSAYGRSILKAPWYHYDKLHKLLYATHVGVELGAVKFRHLKKLKKVDSAADDLLFNALLKSGIENVVQYNSDDYEILFDTVTDAQTLAIAKDLIQYHTTQMSKALLMGFMDLGVTSNTGARALSNDQLAFFKDGVNSIAQVLIEEPWNKIIADLCKMNFNRGIYPQLKLDPLSNENIETLFEAFLSLANGGQLVDSLKAKIQEMASDKLNLDIDGETITEELEAKKLEEEERKQQMLQSAGVGRGNFGMKSNAPASLSKDQKDQKKQDLSDHIHLEDVETAAIYPDERKLKAMDIRLKIESAKAEAKMILSQKLDRQKGKIINEYLKAIRSGRKSIKKLQVELEEENEDRYSEALYLLALGLLEFGKITAANELNKGVPGTTAVDKQILQDKVDNIIAKQSSDLEFRLRQVAGKGLQRNLPENEIRNQMDEEYNNLFSSILGPTIAAIVPDALNQGRDITFSKYQTEIFAYRFTNQFYGNTAEVCAYCRSLNGIVVQYSDPNYSLLTGPLHFGCQCGWSPITPAEAEAYGIQVTGRPSDIPVFYGLNSFKGL